MDAEADNGQGYHSPQICQDFSCHLPKDIIRIFSSKLSCPKCERHIDRSEYDCLQMKCRTAYNAGCGHEFCILCLGDWKAHSSNIVMYNTLFGYRPKYNRNVMRMDPLLIPVYAKYNNIEELQNKEMNKITFKMGTHQSELFFIYQSANAWLRQLTLQYDPDCCVEGMEAMREDDFIKQFINFNTINDNLLLLLHGYTREIALDFPFELVELCISLITDYHLRDKWDASTIVKHNSMLQLVQIRTIVFSDYDCQSLNVKMEKGVSTFSIKTKLKISAEYPFVRKVWNIKIVSDEAIDNMFLEIGFNNNKIIGRGNGYKVKISVESGDIVSVLVINFNGDGFMMLGKNGRIMSANITIFSLHHTLTPYHLTTTFHRHKYVNTNQFIRAQLL
eukprot:255082_1